MNPTSESLVVKAAREFQFMLPRQEILASSRRFRETTVLTNVQTYLLNPSALSLLLQELVATSGSDRNWKGMFISTLVILSILGLITLSVVIMREDEKDDLAGPKVSFADFLSDSLAGNAFNGTWISGKEQHPHDGKY